jgi:hypothetical protein
LILVADNAADNKNMDVIAFTCELVARDWFDIVEFYFGEVGHTHNGEDSTHHVLNEHVGRHVALTLGEHVLNYAKVWTTKESTPEAVVAHDQYDWKTRYGSNDVVHRLGGFTKTKLDPESVHAWHVRRSRTGPVEVLWKKRATDKEWLGEHGTEAMKSDGVGSPGFMCLKKTALTCAMESGARETEVPERAQGSLHGAASQGHVQTTASAQVDCGHSCSG